MQIDLTGGRLNTTDYEFFVANNALNTITHLTGTEEYLGMSKSIFVHIANIILNDVNARNPFVIIAFMQFTQ